MALYSKFRARTRGALEVPSSLFWDLIMSFNKVEIFEVFFTLVLSSSDRCTMTAVWEMGLLPGLPVLQEEQNDALAVMSLSPLRGVPSLNYLCVCVRFKVTQCT